MNSTIKTQVSSDDRWHNTGQETSKVIETIRDDRGMWIADCQRGSGQLIATAPQLLAALQECADWLCDANMGTDQWERGQKAIDVINQATRNTKHH